MDNLDHACSEAVNRALSLDDLGVIAPHKEKIYNRGKLQKDQLLNPDRTLKVPFRRAVADVCRADQGEQSGTREVKHENRNGRIPLLLLAAPHQGMPDGADKLEVLLSLELSHKEELEAIFTSVDHYFRDVNFVSPAPSARAFPVQVDFLERNTQWSFA